MFLGGRSFFVLNRSSGKTEKTSQTKTCHHSSQARENKYLKSKTERHIFDNSAQRLLQCLKDIFTKYWGTIPVLVHVMN